VRLRTYVLAWGLIVGGAIAAVSCSGCATVKSDVKAVADVCKPELAGDAEQMLPLVLAYALCDASGGDCSSQAKAIADEGKADAAICAAAELHAATVKLAHP
jgi:hypothetical protein